MVQSEIVWREQTANIDSKSKSVACYAIKPDHSVVLVATGSDVLAYDSTTFKAIKTLKGHKDAVNSLSWSSDGLTAASCGSDKYVIVWDGAQLSAAMKYSHNDTVNHVTINPQTGHILSCSISDFGIWSPDKKGVQKQKTNSGISCCAWSYDGSRFALGHNDGLVSLRDLKGDEIIKIQRAITPIISLTWNSNAQKDGDICLAIVDRNQTMSFHAADGSMIGKEKKHSSNIRLIKFSPDGNYLVTSDAENTVHLWTNEGIRILQLLSSDSSINFLEFVKSYDSFIVGYENGVIERRKISSTNVFYCSKSRFASRSNMTDIVIQHLTTNQKARIRCRDLVEKISMYRNQLAIGLPSRVILYELNTDSDLDMHYKLKYKHNIPRYNQLVSVSNGFLVSRGQNLELFALNGSKEAGWSFESEITAIKVLGGSNIHECCIVGTKTGEILQIIIDNPFFSTLTQLKGTIKQIDVDAEKRYLAVVDDTQCLTIFDKLESQCVFQDLGVLSAKWSTDCPNVLAYSGNGVLKIKHILTDAQSNLFDGEVINLTGSTLHYMVDQNLASMTVSFSETVKSLKNQGELDLAYELSCDGIPEDEVQSLGLSAFEAMNLDLAKRCFSNSKNMCYLDLIEAFHLRLHGNVQLLQAELKALNKDFHQAARLFKESGNPQRALEMYTDLQMFEEATKLSTDLNINSYDILKKQAKHLEDSKEPLTAARLYFEVGDTVKAIDLLGSWKLFDELKIMAHRLSKSDTKAINLCLGYLDPFHDKEIRKEMYVKLDDYKNLALIHVEDQDWESAFNIAKQHPEISKDVFIPYAKWLAMNDRFEEAKDMFMKAGEKKEAMNVLHLLVNNARSEERYQDMAYYYWLMAQQYCGEYEPSESRSRQTTKRVKSAYESSLTYLAYHFLFKYCTQPYTETTLEALLNMSRYLVTMIQNRTFPEDLSPSVVVYSAAKLCQYFRLFKSLNIVLELCLQVRLPENWQMEVNDIMLLARGNNASDVEDYLPVCFGCTSINSWIGERCKSCLEPFVISPCSFIVLPVVSFEVQDDCDDRDNPFSRAEIMGINSEYQPIVISRMALNSLDGVFSNTIGHERYYKKLIPQEELVQCGACQHLFLEEEWNHQALVHGTCVICRTSAVVK